MKIYTIFPYLNTQQTFEIEGLTFKGFFETGKEIVNNLSKENKDDQFHLDNLLKSFILPGGGGLTGFTYVISELKNQEEYEDLKIRMQNATNIIRYKIFEDERGAASFPQTTIFMYNLTDDEVKGRARRLRSKEKEFIFYRG